MLESLHQLGVFIATKVLLAQAYGEGTYGSLSYGSNDTFFGLPLPNTGGGILFWLFALMFIGGIATLIWRHNRSRKLKKSAMQATTPKATTSAQAK